MSDTLAFEEVGRLPMPQDNVAVAVRRLEAGMPFVLDGRTLRIGATVMEGHRFAVKPLAAGESLLSWGLPFGTALGRIQPGDYVCNQGMLDALAERELDFALPPAPNFTDRIEPFALDTSSIVPGVQVPRSSSQLDFQGFVRPGGRGVGTRNYIVVVGTSARTAGLARLLAERGSNLAARCPGVDGVVALDHTEGGARHRPNNLEVVLRALCGFCTHPNVAAFVALDYGVEPVTNRLMKEYAAEHGYPLDAVPHLFLTVDGGIQQALEAAERQIREWLEGPARGERSLQPLSALRLALQCGGSDAFSGISGNPLAGLMAREVIRQGGAANLGESDELVGAESYVLQNVRDQATAARFVELLERFKMRMAWHGQSPEGNPSPGNRYRGLYNIALKSIGAARKRDPEVRLDWCIEYAEPMRQPGFYFMDSPGNDLESVAGQVAAGCNLILFVTGNGSVTNFPFVPTLKFVTTTARYELLAADMDVNAGAYQDGTPMPELGASTLALVRAVASGQPSLGEQAGHAQVQLWRDWPQTDGRALARLQSRPAPRPTPARVSPAEPPPCRLSGYRGPAGTVFDQVGLVLPASMCSAQVARLAVERLRKDGLDQKGKVRRLVALPHTEGCGSTAAELMTRAAIGYLLHPSVRAAVVLEHGCEKTHNDHIRHRLMELGVDPAGFGWASVQRDGGNRQAMEHVARLFAERLSALEPLESATVGLEALRLGVLASGQMPASAAAALARVTKWVVSAGGTVVLPEGLALPGLTVGSREEPLPASLAWAEQAPGSGLYVSQMPTDQWLEMATGVAACGVDILLAFTGEHPLTGHPLIPLVQVTCCDARAASFADDLDLVLSGEPESWATRIMEQIARVVSGTAVSVAMARGHVGIQITRGLLGVSY